VRLTSLTNFEVKHECELAPENCTNETGGQLAAACACGTDSFRLHEGDIVEIVVFAKIFKRGNWEIWEHRCSPEEINAIEDSARGYAQNRLSMDTPLPVDYLQGAGYIFDVARGLEDKPRDGDKRVHGVSVNGVLIGVTNELTQHPSEPKKVA